MRLENKETGEIGYFSFANQDDPVLIVMDKNGVQLAKYSSLAELTAEWCDAPEEPKEWWYIDADGELICDSSDDRCEFDNNCREIGNYFSSREEAEKAVEKLKAWKRLKDKGFKFEGRDKPNYGEKFIIECSLPKETLAIDVAEDLDLLFWRMKKKYIIISLFGHRSIVSEEKRNAFLKVIYDGVAINRPKCFEEFINNTKDKLWKEVEND